MRERYAWVILLVVGGYMAAAFTRYAFNHPDYTDLRLLQHIGDVLLWR